MGKLERCRKDIKGNSHRALDCFSEVMIEGNKEEKHIASYFLEMLVDTAPGYIPSISEAAKRVRRRATAAADNTGGAVPTAVIYHGGQPLQEGRRRLNTPYRRARYVRTRSNTRAPSSWVVKGKAVKFQIEDITPNLPVPVNSAKVSRRPRDEAHQVGGYDVREKTSILQPMEGGPAPSGMMDVSSVTLQLLNLTPNLKINQSATLGAKENSTPVVSDSMEQSDLSKVVLARLNTSTAGFTIEDDLAQEEELSAEPVREVFFETDAVEIADAQISAMEQASKLWETNSGIMTVRGLASPSESNPDNLSKIRAKIVAHLLKQKFHIPSAKIQVEWGVGANQEDQRVLMIVRASQ
ncbi:MAG TPA: hypothetical protein DCL44_05145 [Elusimicrobia bacterium]|nr:hypothetical protein [Elusimicrobiota bacterium]